MNIRMATLSDLSELEKVERICFPPAEAASGDSIAKRLRAFPNHFRILEEDGKIIGFINGMVSDTPVISDDMFDNAGLHDENGAWQGVFGLDVLPEYRRRGYAALLMKSLIDAAKSQGRKGCVLTCKEHLVGYYEKFGYKNQGISKSTHGGAVWYDMRLEF